jgi:hypothetical protein
MSAVDIDAAADELLAAYRTGKTLPPLTSTYPGLTVDEAYAIQQRQTLTRTGAGAGIVGFKIGLTSAAMQQQLGVDQPDYVWGAETGSKPLSCGFADGRARYCDASATPAEVAWCCRSWPI